MEVGGGRGVYSGGCGGVGKRLSVEKKVVDECWANFIVIGGGFGS